MFQRLADRIRETGHVQPHKNKNKQLPRPVIDEKAPDVLAAVYNNPQKSLRHLCSETATSRACLSGAS